MPLRYDPNILDPTRPAALLAACPVAKPTPLRAHSGPQGGKLWVKDESHRMGLGAFKALGGVYAVARLIADQIGAPADPAAWITPQRRALAADLTFVCASAGNHGLAVAAGARLFGARARIFLSHSVDPVFADRLMAQGAQVCRAGDTYEASMDAATADAAHNGAVLLADASWPGYSEPPRLVMEGYTVLAAELRASFAQSQSWPRHVYLQAGVGGFAAATAFMIRRDWPVQPRIVIVEPDAAPCLRRSVAVGQPVQVTGPLSIMGRLDCKAPSTLALDILTQAADAFVTVSDPQAQAATHAAEAMGYATTPSGAAGLAALLADPVAPESALVILTEGAVG